MATWFIVEVDSNRLHPSIVSVSGIIYVAFKSLKDKKESLDCLHDGPKTFFAHKREGDCDWTWKPEDLKSLVMRSWILALSAAETANEFNASSENSRCSVRETCSPGSTIPYKTNISL